MALLEVRDLRLSFGGVHALNRAIVSVEKGTIHTVIGPNGAGKTSVLNCICGYYRPQSGAIMLEGHNLIGLRPHQIVRLGVGRVFQNIELFKNLTVLENVLLGRHIHLDYNLLQAVFYYGKPFREEMKNRRIAEEIIDFLEIEGIRELPVGILPHGTQKRVELARALATQPKLLILDEPFTGMNVEEKEDMARFILDVNRDLGVTVLLIDHDMRVVMDLSDRVTVMNFGETVLEGTPEEVQGSEVATQVYLGTRRKQA